MLWSLEFHIFRPCSRSLSLEVARTEHSRTLNYCMVRGIWESSSHCICEKLIEKKAVEIPKVDSSTVSVALIPKLET
jgi:hypothetical protein